MQDSLNRYDTQTDKLGSFLLSGIPYGIYKIRFSYVGLQSLQMDSIHIRSDRYDFNLNDIILKPGTGQELEAVIIYAEKQYRTGKTALTFSVCQRLRVTLSSSRHCVIFYK